jgi:hypothetical protein
MCAWHGCSEMFVGDIPPGWVYLLTYWAPRPVLDLRAGQMHRGEVLCPVHNWRLELLLKERG